MPGLELDHVFVFSDPSLPELKEFESHGFQVHLGRAHSGQGTGNRCVMFEENYLELIFLTSEKEALTNPLRLDRRAHWRETGVSPFGIALRGELSAGDRRDFWAYHAPYLPLGRTILVHKDSEGNGPMIFMTPSNGKALAEMRPGSRADLDPSLLRHASGSRKITALDVLGPGYLWPLRENVAGLQFGDSDQVQITVKLDGAKPLAWHANSILKVVVGSEG